MCHFDASRLSLKNIAWNLRAQSEYLKSRLQVASSKKLIHPLYIESFFFLFFWWYYVIFLNVVWGLLCWFTVSIAIESFWKARTIETVCTFMLNTCCIMMKNIFFVIELCLMLHNIVTWTYNMFSMQWPYCMEFSFLFCEWITFWHTKKIG
jgi:hypothetical protein